MKKQWIIALVLVVALTMAATITAVALSGDDEPSKEKPTVADNGPNPVTVLQGRYRLSNKTNPTRTVVTDSSKKTVAVLTVGARTVLLKGPERTFTEPATTSAKIITTDWVRIAPKPYLGFLDKTLADWLLKIIGSTAEDVLAISQQYTAGTPIRRDDKNIAYAGPAGFGFLNNDQEKDGSDFFEYLGVPYDFPDGRAEIGERWRGDRRLDCSGFLRMVYGYRSGMPVLRGNKAGTADGLPRSTYAMANKGILIEANEDISSPPESLARIQTGDAVFFALRSGDYESISHSGIYLGEDTDGRMRFVSSRETADGPTWGDTGGRSVLDSGVFGNGLRRVVRF